MFPRLSAGFRGPAPRAVLGAELRQPAELDVDAAAAQHRLQSVARARQVRLLAAPQLQGQGVRR